MKPTFSIITVSYNSVKTIERTIKSVLSQINQDYEYIIVDGGSTDGTLDVIRGYETLFKGRLKYTSEPDKGIYDAMNKGIARADGAIIGIVNSDDWLEEDALATITEVINQEDEKDTVYCAWMNFHYSDGESQVLKSDRKSLEDNAPSYIMAGVRHPAVFVHKNVYDKLGTFDTRMKVSADTDFILRSYFNDVKFSFVNKVVTNMSDGGVSNRNLFLSINDYKLILEKHDVPSFEREKLVLKYCIKVFIKSMMPTHLLKLYRKF